MPSKPRTGLSLILVAVLAVAGKTALAQDVETGTPVEEVPEDSVSGALDDSTGSIEKVWDTVKDVLYKGWRRSGDFRFGFVRAETVERDGSEGTDSDWRARLRYGATYNVNDWLIFDARLVTGCTTDDCNPELSLDPSNTRVSSIDPGTVTFDQFYLHAFRLKRFDAAIGRLQTKFVTRAGVFAKSLDRNNSNAFNVNWTDGIHGAYHLPDDSIVHFIAEYNDEDGASNIRRNPLDFTRSSARWGYFVAWESLERQGPFMQRGIDITYLPSSLLKNGDLTGAVDDYVGIVGRLATSRPFGTKGRRWNVTGEIGYAPETPSKSGANLAGDGDVDGLAWAVTASLMDLWPSHSFGINYARTDPGWLLSPQYRDNEELFEIRYLWRKSDNLVIDARVRWREELERELDESQKLDELDFFARFTLGF